MFTRRNPVEMPADGPVTSSGGELAYGGFWARFAALVIDNAILTVAAIVLVIVVSLADEGLAEMVSWIYVLASLLYWPLLESSARQATFGKRLLGLQVTDAAGQRLSFVRALLRTLAKIISAIPLYIGFLLAAFTSRKQALHDIIVSTLVLRSGESHFMKAVAATAAAVLLTVACTYYYVSSIYLPRQMAEMEKTMKVTQKPAPKPPAQQAPGQAIPTDKPAPPAAAEPAPVKPAAAPAAPEPAPKVVATAPVKEPAQPAKPAAAPAPAPAKPAIAEIKPAPAKQPAAAAPAAPAKPASPEPMKIAAAPAAKVKPAPKPEPAITAGALVEEAPKTEQRPAPEPRPAPSEVEWSRVPVAGGPGPVYNDIMTAVMYRDQAAATQLLNLGWWPDRPDSNGVTPLMAAAMNGDAAMTELLLSRGANPLLRGPAGSTVDYANRGGNAKVADLLRKAGAR